MKSLPPKSDTEETKNDLGPSYPTDFQSLMSGAVTDRRPERPRVGTDFQSLKDSAFDSKRMLQRRTTTDILIDGLTPFMVFLMIYSVIAFLLDVRFVYLSLQNSDWLASLYENTIRVVAFCLIVGVVALNRLIARDGSDESILYSIGLAMSVGLYTLSTTESVGSIANNFMNRPWLATCFNMGVVATIWWVTNRLTHECCVDENITAGDIGILTGTARRVHNAITDHKLKTGTDAKEEPYILQMELEAVEPSEWKRQERRAPKFEAPVKPLPKRHPGISVFYASIVVMAIFVIGQWVLRNGDIDLAFRANVCLFGYTISALSLLMLSSLGGLRGYFQEKNVRIPSGIGPFWIGLGSIMIAVVIVGACRIPGPIPPTPKGLVTYANGFQEQFANGKTSQAATAVTGTLAEAMTARFPVLMRFFSILENVVLVLMLLACLYLVLRFVGAFALSLSGQRRGVPRAIARFFGMLDSALQRLLKLPSFEHGPKSLRRVSRSVATSIKYSNPLGDDSRRNTLTPQAVVEYSYTALCALAEDLAAPRKPDQTPFEFIESFPPALEGLREDAVRLTNLYVISAYSNIELDERTLDTVRRFWRSYNLVRDIVVR
jgi:hypothetical protein